VDCLDWYNAIADILIEIQPKRDRLGSSELYRGCVQKLHAKISYTDFEHTIRAMEKYGILNRYEDKDSKKISSQFFIHSQIMP
jgi:hypothetical protein